MYTTPLPLVHSCLLSVNPDSNSTPVYIPVSSAPPPPTVSSVCLDGYPTAQREHTVYDLPVFWRAQISKQAQDLVQKSHIGMCVDAHLKTQVFVQTLYKKGCAN